MLLFFSLCVTTLLLSLCAVSVVPVSLPHGVPFFTPLCSDDFEPTMCLLPMCWYPSVHVNVASKVAEALLLLPSGVCMC